jgi:NAD(P)-dependent dehydrogenase (short-subunit alcohol dehydrogenase family)
MQNSLAEKGSSLIPRTVLVTGAAGGIGRAIVQLFAISGWRVIGVDRSHRLSQRIGQ